jgi:hypothetical protein
MLLFVVWSLSAAVADVTLPHEYMGRDPDESPTRWEVKRWLNVPGPFYTGWTDTCWTGRQIAPNNVLYSGDGDSACEEFIFRQPRDEAELAAVVAAAAVEVYAGYACDGDQHWTPALVREWWAERAAVSGWIRDRERDEQYLHGWDPAGEEMLEDGIRAFAAHLEGPLEGDLQRYLFRLETGADATPADRLPRL